MNLPEFRIDFDQYNSSISFRMYGWHQLSELDDRIALEEAVMGDPQMRRMVGEIYDSRGKAALNAVVVEVLSQLIRNRHLYQLDGEWMVDADKYGQWKIDMEDARHNPNLDSVATAVSYGLDVRTIYDRK